MRILMLASEYPPAKVFGLGRAVHDLSRALAEQGEEVHVMTNSIGGRDQDTEMAGVQVHRINFPSPPQPPDSTSCVVQFNICLVERAAEILPQLERFDLLHAHDWLVALAADSIRRRHELPLVTTVHDTAVGKYFGRLDRAQQYISFTERWLIGGSSRVVSVSRHIRQELIEHYGAEAARIDVIPCGVAPAPFDVPVNLSAFRSVFAQPDERIVLYVGRLDPEKGVEVLLRGFAELAGRHADLRLVAAGEGQLKSALLEDAESLGLQGRVTFLGYVGHPALAALYRSASVIVVPSLYEPFGMVALEGMISGRPVIASDAGGLLEVVIDEQTGLCVPAGDSKALSRAMARVLEDPELAKKLADGGRAHACERYSWSEVASRTRESYAKAVQQGMLGGGRAQ